MPVPIPPRAALKLLGRAHRLSDDQIDRLTQQLHQHDQWDSAQAAECLGTTPQWIRVMRSNLRKTLAAGRTAGPNDMVPETKFGRLAQYDAAQTVLFALQTWRRLPNWNVNDARPTSGNVYRRSEPPEPPYYRDRYSVPDAGNPLLMLARAHNMTDQQAMAMLSRYSSEQRWTLRNIADRYGVDKDTPSKWRNNRLRAERTGRSPGPEELCEPIPGDPTHYRRGSVELWGDQTLRSRPVDGTAIPPHERPRGGWIPGRRAVPATPWANLEERNAVVAAYRRHRKAGLDDRAARNKTAVDVNISKAKVAQQLRRAAEDPDAYGPIWQEGEQT